MFFEQLTECGWEVGGYRRCTRIRGHLGHFDVKFNIGCGEVMFGRREFANVALEVDE